jgi:glycosyltransferase involved in cell wall biosynthesis
VLILAEAANPEWASVPLVGWSLARALGELVDAHVVTQVRNREAMERAGWREGVEFTALDSEKVARPTWRLTEALRRLTGLGWTTNTALAAIPYYYFERLVWRRFGEDLRARRFDLVHRVTPLSPTTPSVIAGRCRAAGVPFLWGPLNGGVAWPAEFTGVQRKEGEWLSYVRGAHRLLPGYRGSRRDAAAILVGSRATWEQLEGHHDRCVYLPENGIDPARFAERPAPPAAPPLRVAFVGRLVPYKGADMLLEAVAPLVRAGQVRVDVVGDGPEREALSRQVAAEGLAGGVTLHGWVAHTEVQHLLARCHVLGFPSVREFGGGVVLEAMAMGVVPVVVDYAGPAELVTEATGYRVPLGRRPAIVEGFRRVLGELARDPSPLGGMSARARQRVAAQFTWEVKARQVREVYRWVLGQGPRPDFGMPLPDDLAAAARAQEPARR